MALKVRATQRNKCDKCNKKLSLSDNRIVELEFHERDSYTFHCIRIHEKCFKDAVASLKPVAETLEGR